MHLTSAKGLIALLDETDKELKVLALHRLLDVVDVFWPEISDSVARVEEIYEDSSLSEKTRQLAALIASKVYYHLGSYDDALEYALGAGKIFNVSDASSTIQAPSTALFPSKRPAATAAGIIIPPASRKAHAEYIATMVSKCIDKYIALQKHNFDMSGGSPEAWEHVQQESLLMTSSETEWAGAKSLRRAVSGPSAQLAESENVVKRVDPRMKSVVEQMFDQCIFTEQYRQAVGLAIECRRVDLLEKTLLAAPDIDSNVSRGSTVSGAGQGTAAVTQAATGAASTQTQAGAAALGSASGGNTRRDLLQYTFQICMSLLDQRRAFRQSCLELLVKIYLDQLRKPDLLQVSQCLIFLDDPRRLTIILQTLLLESVQFFLEPPPSKQDDRSLLLAYQMAFDLYENAPQHLINRLLTDLEDQRQLLAADANAGNQATSSAASSRPNTAPPATSGQIEQGAGEPMLSGIEQRMDTDSTLGPMPVRSATLMEGDEGASAAGSPTKSMLSTAMSISPPIGADRGSADGASESDSRSTSTITGLPGDHGTGTGFGDNRPFSGNTGLTAASELSNRNQSTALPPLPPTALGTGLGGHRETSGSGTGTGTGLGAFGIGSGGFRTLGLGSPFFSRMSAASVGTSGTPLGNAALPTAYEARLNKLREILNGNKTRELHLQFLIRANHTDMLQLRTLKDAVRQSIPHNATIIANGFMHFGTTQDSFLRDNLEWLARATHWARFSATASLGVIHFGHERDSLKLMAAYLPKENGSGPTSTAYAEGGGLYALGLIHANHANDQIIKYLEGNLKQHTAGEPVKHGACLALGMAGMGLARGDIYETLKTVIALDEAVIGEAAALAAGLLMLGTGNSQVLADMLGYSKDTQHEKILRGIALCIALLNYQRLEDADSIIDSLLDEKDPVMRWSGAYVIALAYAGTGNNDQLRRLLHIAVSDVNDDVRRAAVISIGFLLFRAPEQCPAVVSLLTESYNAHVRYGAAMALGIACAGTGYREAITLLEPLMNDQSNFVRQGTLIASALIMVGHNQNTCNKLTSFREQALKVAQDKHEEALTKFGAVMALGILDAGGRNVTISLQSRTGHTSMQAVVGLFLFQHFWYWFPMAHMLALSFTPNSIVALNSRLEMPKLQLKSCARSSLFAYPPPMTEKQDKKQEKIDSAVLSVTAKAKKKEEEKKREKAASRPLAAQTSVGGTAGDVQMDTSDPAKSPQPVPMEVTESADSKDKEKEKKEGDGEKEKEKDKDKEKEKEKEKEKPFELLENPTRVMRAQLPLLQLLPDSRYEPLKELRQGGIIMVLDKQPGESTELVELARAHGPQVTDELPEPEPPQPFVYTE